MNDSRDPKIVYEWELDGRSRRGQQPVSWKQKIEETIRNLNITIKDA